MLLFKSYVATPGPPPPPGAGGDASRHAFLFSRATEREAQYATLGAAAAGMESDLLPGVEEGLRGMRVGGRRMLVVPPKLAYGAAGARHVTGMRSVTVPPHATLLFHVEVAHAMSPGAHAWRGEQLR